jgi:hypothetical protein
MRVTELAGKILLWGGHGCTADTDQAVSADVAELGNGSIL